MKGMDIYKSLGHISEEMIQEAELTTGKLTSNKWNWKHFTAMASSLVLIVGLSLFFMENGGSDGGLTESSGAGDVMSGSSGSDTDAAENGGDSGGISGSSGSSTGTDEEEYQVGTLYFNKFRDSRGSDKKAVEGYFTKKLEHDVIFNAFPHLKSLEETSGLTELSGTTSYSSKDNVATFYDGHFEYSLENNKKVYLDLRTDGWEVWTVFEEDEPIESEILGVPVLASIWWGSDRGHCYEAKFEIGDISYRVLMYDYETREDSIMPETTKNFFTDLVTQMIFEGQTDLSLFDVPPEEIPFLLDEELTQSEMFEEEDFGRYMPDFSSLLHFESSKRLVTQEKNYLDARWSPTVKVEVRNMTKTDEKRLVSAEDTYVYDVSMFPYNRDDPDEYELRNTIQDKEDFAIFLAEELTQEMVNMRVGKYKQNTHVYVLYGDVLVKVYANYLSGDDIWDALKDLPREIS